jgi:hypothetical protein
MLLPTYSVNLLYSRGQTYRKRELLSLFDLDAGKELPTVFFENKA